MTEGVALVTMKDAAAGGCVPLAAKPDPPARFFGSGFTRMRVDWHCVRNQQPFPQVAPGRIFP